MRIYLSLDRTIVILIFEPVRELFLRLQREIKMKGVFESVVMAGIFVGGGLATGTPVLAERATTTLTPITITGNGMVFLLFRMTEKWGY